MSPLAPGKPAPAFALPDQDETIVQLKDFKDRPLVVFFFPKANTPG